MAYIPFSPRFHKPRAVIFDCDGVLVDSERLFLTHFAEEVSSLGWSIDYPTARGHFHGRDQKHAKETIERVLGRELPQAFFEELHTKLDPIMGEKVLPIPGVHEAIDQIDVPICVASGSPHSKLRVMLERVKLYHRFGRWIFSCEEVEFGKPAPDIFLYAAHHLGVLPEKCAVIEDSPAGVRAGVAAGMTVFGYAGETAAEELEEEGATVFTDMRELPALLGF